jgi:hypothetical protein
MRPTRRVPGGVAVEWIVVKMSSDMEQEGDWTVSHFGHEGCNEMVEVMHHRSPRWAVCLLSSKPLLETGTATPNNR